MFIGSMSTDPTIDSTTDLRAVFTEAAQYFPTPLQQFQFFDKTSRFDYDKGRRETWPETVDRAIGYLTELAPQMAKWLHTEGRHMILTMQALPSMRLLAMAGPAAQRQNLAIYNCSYLPVDDVQAFVEMLIISMAGCGVGFSVEHGNIDKLPTVAVQTAGAAPCKYLVEDSTEGWAAALHAGIDAWWLQGHDIEFDVSRVRPTGEPLRTKGGQASGPEPLLRMLRAFRDILLARQGQRLRSIDAHDLACAVGDAAVSGGVRRTAMISLYSQGDELMRNAKTGDYPMIRWNANNSEVWRRDPTDAEIEAQMSAMFAGMNGEPNIFSGAAAARTMLRRRHEMWQTDIGSVEASAGTNPCGEIVLRPMGLCNLSIAVARSDDTYMTLARKVEAATVFGTIQATATHFPGLRPDWQRNAERERLLGVDITGQMDCPLLIGNNAAGVFDALRVVARLVNDRTAKQLGISPAAAITTVKPAGNSAALLNCGSGVHGRHSAYYVRNARVSAHSPVYRVLRDAGAPLSPENGQTAETATTWVCAFPCRAPEGAIVKADLSAADQLNHWLINKRHWTEHNPSCTITYRPDEQAQIVEWVKAHREEIGGISFLPAVSSTYEQMPYVEIDEVEYRRRLLAFPAIDWSHIALHEAIDMTTSAQEVVCTGDRCELR